MIYHKYKDSTSGGGFVNNAFEDDDEDLENKVTYARWINKKEYNDDSDIELGVKKNSIAEELDDVLRNRTLVSSECQKSGDGFEEDEDIDIYQRPSPGVSRRLMLRKLSSLKSDDQVCADKLCPYNQWLYCGEEFPEYKLLKKWEIELRSKHQEQEPPEDLNPSHLDELDPRQLARLLHTRSERHQSASERSPSFSFTSFQFPSFRSSHHKESESTPLPSQPPPYTFATFTSPSTISANYPIVTLPRSQRKERSSLFNSLFKPSSELNISMNDSLPWKSPYKPPSTSSSSSCSCSSSSFCSSCSSCYEMETVNDVRLAQYPFIRDTIKKKTRRALRLSFPKCDLTCYFITSFILLCLAGVAAVFVYFYIFAPIS